MSTSTPHLAALNEEPTAHHLASPSSSIPTLSSIEVGSSQGKPLLEQFQDLKSTLRRQSGTSMDRKQSTSIQEQEMLNQIQQLVSKNQQLSSQVEQLSGQVQAQKKETLEVIGPTFHPFSRLPVEIRLMVWKFASDVPRFVALQVLDKSTLWCDPINPCRLHCHPCNVPAVLHTSQESREQALKSYDLCAAARGYLNYQVDIVSLYGFSAFRLNGEDSDHLPWPERYFAGISISQIQHLAFNLVSLTECLKPGIEWPGMILAGCTQFPNLRTILFLGGQTDPKGNFVIVPSTWDEGYRFSGDEYRGEPYRAYFLEKGLQEQSDSYRRRDSKVVEHFGENIGLYLPEIKVMRTLEAKAVDSALRCSPL